jgi:hypothetical protein
VNDTVSLAVAGLALLVSVASSYVAWQSLQSTRAAGRPSSMHNLFIANQAAMQYPELLIDVHDIDPTTTPREARALVYLSTVLDGFAEVNGRVYGGDIVKMAAPDCSRRSSRPARRETSCRLGSLCPGSCRDGCRSIGAPTDKQECDAGSERNQKGYSASKERSAACCRPSVAVAVGQLRGQTAGADCPAARPAQAVDAGQGCVVEGPPRLSAVGADVTAVADCDQGAALTGHP